MPKQAPDTDKGRDTVRDQVRFQTAVRPASTLKNAVILAATLFSGARVYYALR